MGLGILVMVEVAEMTLWKILWMASSFSVLLELLADSTQLVRLSLRAWSSSLFVTKVYQVGDLLFLLLFFLRGLGSFFLLWCCHAIRN